LNPIVSDWRGKDGKAVMTPEYLLEIARNTIEAVDYCFLITLRIRQMLGLFSILNPERYQSVRGLV